MIFFLLLFTTLGYVEWATCCGSLVNLRQHDRESHHRKLCISKHDSSSTLVRAFFLGTVVAQFTQQAKQQAQPSSLES